MVVSAVTSSPTRSPPSPESRDRDAGAGYVVFVEIVRFVFTVLGALVGYQSTVYLQHGDRLSFLPHGSDPLAYCLLALLGGLIGFVIGGFVGRLCVRLVDRMERFLARRSAAEVAVGTVGLVVGLAIAALCSLAVVRLPGGPYLLVPLFVVLGYAFAYLAARKDAELLRLIGLDPARAAGEPVAPPPRHLVDTSAIIDGRIIGIIESGFLPGELVVPGFVLAELQRLADSADPEKRARGRRGLDLVRKLMAVRDVQAPDDDYPDLPDVDAKLVRMGQQLDADVLTTDFNLAKVAEIKGVRVLNVNGLAHAVKTAVLPGEAVEVKVLREGREAGQGVGYMDDGTMVVVEDGRTLVGSVVSVEVTSVLQNPAGKMIFARPARAPARA